MRKVERDAVLWLRVRMLYAIGKCDRVEASRQRPLNALLTRQNKAVQRTAQKTKCIVEGSRARSEVWEMTLATSGAWRERILCSRCCGMMPQGWRCKELYSAGQRACRADVLQVARVLADDKCSLPNVRVSSTGATEQISLEVKGLRMLR